MMMIMILAMVMIPCAFSDAPFNLVRDYKWRNLGVCAYCSVEQRCCGAMKHGVENGTIEPMYYAGDRLECSTENIMKFNYTMRQKKVEWCYTWCRFCYQEPELTDITFFASSSIKKKTLRVSVFLGPLLDGHFRSDRNYDAACESKGEVDSKVHAPSRF